MLMSWSRHVAIFVDNARVLFIFFIPVFPYPDSHAPLNALCVFVCVPVHRSCIKTMAMGMHPPTVTTDMVQILVVVPHVNQNTFSRGKSVSFDA